MSREEKKGAFRIVLALLTGVILVAIVNTRTFNDYCSKAVDFEEGY